MSLFGIVACCSGLAPSSQFDTQAEAEAEAMDQADASASDWIVLQNVAGPMAASWVPIKQAKPGQQLVNLEQDAWLPKAAPPTLSQVKAERIAAIDAKTVELIGAGFQHAGKTFSLSMESQINWTNIGMNPTLLTYPYEISTKDDSDVHAFADAAEVQAAYGVAVGTKEAHIGGGRDVKKQVVAITNDLGQPDVPPNYHDADAAKAAVAAVVDPR